MSGPLMPPAIKDLGNGPASMDPSTAAWINAGSNVLGKALAPSPAGPSRSDTGGWFDFGDSPFVVNMGSGSAAGAAGISPWIGMAIAAAIGVIGWKLWKRSA